MRTKLQLTMCAMMLLWAASASAQYNELMCSKRPISTRLIQVDQLENSTVFYFEMSNEERHMMNVFEDIVVRDEDFKKYKLMSSYNMPLSDEDHSRQLVLKEGQTHRFALEFEKVPLDRPLDIVESEGNPRAMNFYEITIDTNATTAKIDYDNWVKDYPVMESGSYVEDGSVIQYVTYKGLMLTAHMQQTNEYGKYYTVDLYVQNYSNKDVLLDPARITATTYNVKKQKTMRMNVLSAEDYNKKIESDQFWTNVFVIAAEVAVTAAVAYAESKSDKKHDTPPPPRHSGWRPSHRSHHPYYPTDHYRDRYNSRDMGGLATATVALGSAALTAGMMEEQQVKREALESAYIKANNIRPGKEYLGYFHIKYEKTDNLVVKIPMMGESFQFNFQWQNKK